MKFETGDSRIREFVGLAAKLYSMELVDACGAIRHDKKGKGIPKFVIKKKTTHEEYKAMLFDPSVSEVSFYKLGSEAHQMQKQRLTKKKLTAYNDKVFQLSSMESRPLGHYRNKAGC